MSEASEKKEKNKQDKTRYLIIGYSRPGTTVTHLALMGHPNVSALNGELRPAPFFTNGISTFTHGNDPEDEKDKAHSAIFDAISLMRANESTFVHGAKTANNTPKLAQEIVTVLQQNLKDLKIIIIFRKDLVAQYGSGKVGRKSGIMHSWHKGFEGRKVDRIKINKWLFINYANDVYKMYGALSELKKHMTYWRLFTKICWITLTFFMQKFSNFSGFLRLSQPGLLRKKFYPLLIIILRTMLSCRLSLVG